MIAYFYDISRSVLQPTDVFIAVNTSKNRSPGAPASTPQSIIFLLSLNRQIASWRHTNGAIKQHGWYKEVSWEQLSLIHMGIAARGEDLIDDV